MATESSAKRTTFEDMVFTLFALFLVAQIIHRVPILLEEKLGIDITGDADRSLLVAGAALSEDTALGTRVSTPTGTDYFDEPDGTKTATGKFKPGTSLILRGGPKTDTQGTRWWFVEDPSTGTTGWVPEHVLVRDGVSGIGPTTELGTRVRALLDADVWKSPGGLVSLGRMKMGEWGALSDGPVTYGGSRWWFFDREGLNEDGWVPESALTLYSEKGWHERSVVRATRGTDMYEHAGGGASVGVLGEGDTVRIVGGPVLVGGQYWWLVKDDSGVEGWVPESALEDAGVRGWWRGVLTALIFIGVGITVLLLAAVIYITVRTNQIRAKEAQRIRAAVPSVMKEKRNERWDKVIDHVRSDNPNDWRLAIIEADIMLDEVVTRMGYHGTSLGEKMKQIAKGDMRSLDAAWDAHRVRNQIAHEGSDFILTQREAQRVIDLYAAVFQELKYI